MAGSGIVEILSVVGIQSRGRLVMAKDETSAKPWERGQNTGFQCWLHISITWGIKKNILMAGPHIRPGQSES